LRKTTAKKQDLQGRHNTKRACTILLFAKKIKKFIPIPHKHLAISVNRKIADFRTKRASLCKGWGDNFFLVGVKVNMRKRAKENKFRKEEGNEEQRTDDSGQWTEGRRIAAD
jgi:hypothetical protein